MSTRPLSGLTATTARLWLRPLLATDEEGYVRMVERSLERWTPWIPASRPGLTLAERFRKELDRSVRGAAAGTHLRLAAFLRPERPLGAATEPDPPNAGREEPVAMVALNEIVRGVFRNAYASWQVDAAREGHGYGAEAVRALLDLAFSPPPDGVGLHRVQANVMPSNERSLRLATRVGFRREGVALRYLEIAGSWQDHVMFAMTAEEWPTEVHG